jgi:hypothetical protein
VDQFSVSQKSSSEIIYSPAAPPLGLQPAKEPRVHSAQPKSIPNSPPPSLTNDPSDEPQENVQTDDLVSQLFPFSLQETPSWLISLVVHVAIILLLALIPLSGQIRTTISLIAGISQELGEDELSVMDLQTDEAIDSNETMALNLEPSLNDLAPSDIAPSINPAPDLSIKMSIKNGLRGRSGPMKEALLKAYGGTQGTEDAVTAGLKWLAQNQRSDGSWSLVGPYTEGGVNENKPAATAMALLAFMGAGNTHQAGDYKERVQKGMAYLVRLQNREGFFADQSAGNQRTYAHAQCSIAICELYGMTGDDSLRETAQKSIQYAQKSQSKNGGWRYQPREGGDTSVTGWYVMALISGRMAGLDVDSECLERVHQFLNTVQRRGKTDRAADPDGERYAYQSYASPTPSMTAEGMLCRLYLGWETQDPRITRGAELLVGNPISREQDRISYYYWYYATTTLHHIGGQAWTEWNEAMKNELPLLQIKSGKEKGSWPADEDPHGAAGGRLYATCFALYCLESYYRHLPLSEMAPQ